jgi:hypothetical protein
MLAVFIAGMAFEHFVFHAVELKGAELYQKLKELF